MNKPAMRRCGNYPFSCTNNSMNWPRCQRVLLEEDFIMTTTLDQALERSLHDSNARFLLKSLRAGDWPQGKLDCGQWKPIIDMVIQTWDDTSPQNKGQIIEALLNSMIKSGKYPELGKLLSDGPIPDREVPPTLRIVGPSEQQTDSDFPTLPEIAQLPEGLSQGACRWLEEYVQYSKQVSPEGYEQFHEACGLWILSTIAARRIKIPLNKQYTPLMIILVAETSLYAKSETAQVAINVLRAANLRWLLGSDETTPQRLLTDMVGQLPKNYGELEADKQYWIQRRLSMSAQRGWYYDEFGGLIKAMNKRDGIMQDLKGLLLKLDNCPDDYEYSTQSRGIERIEKPYLSLLGCMTPANVRSNAKTGSDFWSDGFGARFVFITPPANTSIDAPFTLGDIPVPYRLSKSLSDWHERLGYPTIAVDEQKDTKERVTGYSVTRSDLPETEVSFGPSVYDAWVRYRSALKTISKNSHSADLYGNYQRLSIKAIRLAALFASLENNNVIELKHFALAQEIAERWRAALHQFYHQVQAGNSPTYAKKIEDDVLRIVKKLEEKGKPPTIKEIRDYLKGVDLGRIKMAIVDLYKAGLLNEDNSGKSPRYSRFSTVEDLAE